MGTNFYIEEIPDCPTCGRQYERLHVGKSSCGWKFVFEAYPERQLTNYKEWMAFLEGKVIKDEYGEPVTLQALKDLIIAKKDGQYSANKNWEYQDGDCRFSIGRFS